MNRVYKVIWSKAKHCYVVTSEIARSVTKSASSARSAGRKGAAVLAMAALLFTAGGVLGEAATANVTDVTVNKPGNVITVTKEGGDPTPFTIDNVDNAKYALKATADGNGEVIHETYAKVDAEGKVAKAVAADSAEQATKDGKGNVISTTYVKIANARVGADGEYVKVANTVGKNLSALDANLSALDEQVKKNTEAVVKVGKTAGETFTDLYAKVQTNADAVAAEATDRKEADKGSLRVNPDGVISKLSNDDGSNPGFVNKLVLNKDGDNQITLSDKGIKVGLNSGVMDKDGFYAGGDDYEHAGAALKWDGSVKGANGDFEVNTGGSIKGAGGKFTVDKDGNADIGGDLTVDKNLTVTGTFDSKTLSSTVDAKDDYTTINGGNVTSEVNDKVGTVDYSAESIFNKDGSSITVRTNEGIVDSTGKSIVGAKEINQYLGDNAKPDGSQKNVTRKMIRNNDGTFSMEDKAVDKTVDGKNKYSTVSQNAGERKFTVTEGTKNLNVTGNLTNGIVSETNDGAKNKVTLTQGMDGTYKVETSGNSTEDIGGKKIENYKDALETTVAKDETHYVKGNQSNKVDGTLTETVKGKVTEDYQDALETTVAKDETHYVKGNQSNKVDGTLTETVKGKVTEDYQDALETTVAKDETHYVKGNQSNKVDGTLTETVKGKVTEDYQDALETTVAKDETHYVKGNQSNKVDGTLTETVKGKVTENYQDALDTTVAKDETHYVKGSQSNTVDGTLTETVTGDVTEDYKANLDTTVTGDSSLSAENIHNTAHEALTNDANTITNTAHDSVTTKIGNGTTVKSVMDVNGIANTASTGTITNYAVTITNKGVASVTNQVNDNKVLVDTNQVKSAFGDTIYTTWDAYGITNDAADKAVKTITGNNTVTSDNDGTTFANEGAKTPFEEGGKTGTRVNTKITGNKVETGKVLTDFAEVANNLDVGGDLNVKGNIETHDAVLSADSRQVVTGRQLYQTNERVDRLDNRIKKVGANAAALAALRPGDFNPDDKFSIAAGFGSYRNANAAALGLFYRPNENVLLSLGTSFGDGENMVNAGVSVKFGRGKSMAERRKEMADEVSSMRDEMRSQDERIAELEEMLKKQSELIEKLSKES